VPPRRLTRWISPVKPPLTRLWYTESDHGEPSLAPTMTMLVGENMELRRIEDVIVHEAFVSTT
jgi:hypothetical protein